MVRMHYESLETKVPTNVKILSIVNPYVVEDI